MASEEKIVLRSISRPSSTDLKELMIWFIKVFDLGGKEEGLETAMFREIIANNIEGMGVTSKILNKKLDVPRSTVIYHLNRFIYSGLVVRKGRKYYLRSEDMHGTIEELHADIEREFSRMMQFADMMDKLFEEGAYDRRKTKK
jgi:predicted transcriptional regulator